MYNQCKAGLVVLGNAVRYEHPVHMDANGKIVEDESLAFGCPTWFDPGWGTFGQMLVFLVLNLW